MLAVVGIVKNEVDIIELSLCHMLSEGIDHIYLADGCSTDGTREVIDSLSLETDRITVLTDNDEYVQQVAWTNRLAAMAANDGATWIIPNDIDEFVYAVNGDTVANALNSVDESIGKIYMRSYQHLDWNTRQVEPKRLPKVAYRWSPDTSVSIGNHDVNVDGGEYDVLDLREIQFRSFEHFCRKTYERTICLEPAAIANGAGWHHTRLSGFSTEQMEAEWAQITAIPTMHSPIPTHLVYP